jgi:hypothetical protein
VLIAFLEPTTLFQAKLDTPRMLYLLLALEGSGTLDVRCFAGHHTNGTVALCYSIYYEGPTTFITNVCHTYCYDQYYMNFPSLGAISKFSVPER